MQGVLFGFHRFIPKCIPKQIDGIKFYLLLCCAVHKESIPMHVPGFWRTLLRHRRWIFL